ncbi:MAG: 1-(5-phosphoribosyl)-5-[(5-phosphoribosylamino)methylideneamino]imidazole-4-carboxamide isomerase [Dehalococcoidia bacterium]
MSGSPSPQPSPTRGEGAGRGNGSPPDESAAFELIPGIDLRGGRCVRLLHGDFAQETIFADDPAAIARRWQDEGAPRLHVVDLEGSRDGASRNPEAIEAILRTVEIPVQVAGGIRDEAGARHLLDLGADRVVIGTAAVREPELVSALVRRDPASVIVALDAREGVVRTDGWTQSGGVTVMQLARAMTERGVRRFLYTDIGRDGAMAGPNLDAYRELRAATSAMVIASGGVASAQDIVNLVDTGVEGVIVGRALYTGAVRLPEALAALRGAV